MGDVTARPIVRGVALACVLVGVVGGLALVAANDDDVPSAGARISVDGRATLVRLDGSTETLSSGDIVRAGEEVRADAGTFVLELAEGGQLGGRAGFDDAPNTRVIVGERPEVVAGEILLVGDEGLDVDADGTIVALTSDGAAARVDRVIAVRVAAYRGGARVDSAGQERAVPALRQLGIASLGRPAGAADPFVIDEDDPWDRRFLGGAISLTRMLDAWSGSFSSQHLASSANPALYTRAVPALAAESELTGLLARTERQAGEILVGAVLTVLGDADDFPTRWRRVFGFRDEGAGWGLVARDQGLDEESVVDAVAAAVSRSGDAVVDEVALGATTTTTAGGTAPPGTAPGGGDGGSGGGPGTTTATTSPVRTPTTLGDAPVPTVPPVPPVPTTTVPIAPLPPPEQPVPTLPPPDEPLLDTGVPLIDDVLEPIEDILGGLLG